MTADAAGAEALTAQRRSLLNRRSHVLADVTAGYNAVEAAVALASGAVAGSVALVIAAVAVREGRASWEGKDCC